MKVIIDRFEGDMAVVELSDGHMLDVPCILFADAKEGDIVNIIVDKQETERKRVQINDLVNRTFID